jgi:hypothetical protein
MLFSIAVVALVADLVNSSPVKTRSPYAVKEYHHPPTAWTSVGPAPADHVINLQIGLKQGNFEELERHLGEGMFHFLWYKQAGRKVSLTRVYLIILSGCPLTPLILYMTHPILQICCTERTVLGSHFHQQLTYSHSL